MMVKPEYPSVAEQRSEHAALAARPVARAAPPRHHRLRHTRAHGFVPPRGCDKCEKHHQDRHQEERSLVAADDVLLVRQTLYVLLHELISFLRRVELVRPLRELGLRVLGGRRSTVRARKTRVREHDGSRDLWLGRLVRLRNRGVAHLILSRLLGQSLDRCRGAVRRGRVPAVGAPTVASPSSVRGAAEVSSESTDILVVLGPPAPGSPPGPVVAERVRVPDLLRGGHVARFERATRGRGRVTAPVPRLARVFFSPKPRSKRGPGCHHWSTV